MVYWLFQLIDPMLTSSRTFNYSFRKLQHRFGAHSSLESFEDKEQLASRGEYKYIQHTLNKHYNHYIKHLISNRRTLITSSLCSFMELLPVSSLALEISNLKLPTNKHINTHAFSPFRKKNQHPLVTT